MKMFWKTQDHAIDKLLGAQRARQKAPARICREFDPDLANAYIEHSLTTPEATSYELHLSECPPCRKNIVALARMAEADTSAPRAEVKTLSLAGGPQSSLKRLLGAMSVPQWAMAAAAVIVIAISLPVLLSRKDSQEPQKSISDEQAAAQSAPPSQVAGRQESAETTGAAATALAQAEQKLSGNAQPKVEKDQNQEEKNLIAKAAAPPVETSPARVSGSVTTPAPPPSEPEQIKTSSAVADQAASRAAEPAQPPASALASESQRQRGTELEKISPDDARRLQDNKDSAQVSQLARSRADGEDARKQEETIIKEKDNIPPPPKQSGSDAEARREMTQGPSPARRFRPSSSEPPRGVEERKVGGRRFWLRDDIWTDKSYSPDKEMPFVTVIRDTDVYRELLSKHSSMKPFLTGFPENATVIFVYKGTVYKLIPQEGSK